MRRPASYTARVDEQGRFTLPSEATSELGLTAGSEISVLIGRQADGTREYWHQVAEFEFPEHFQSRLRDLLDRNSEGRLSDEGCEILDHLIHQVEWQTTQRARALLELRKLAVPPPSNATSSAA